MAVINGTNNSEILNGGVEDDVINGLDGNDTIDGGFTGVDTLNGGLGNDILTIYTNDEAYGGDGNDLFAISGDTPLIIDGGLGDDTLRFNGGYDLSNTTLTGLEVLATGSNGKLTAAQLAGFSLVTGYDAGSTTAALALTKGGTATVNLSSSLINGFTLTGSTTNDIITFNAAHLHGITAYLGFGNDRVFAAAGNDSLRGEAGNDSLSGLGGNDSLDGGEGNDTLLGGANNDILYVNRGDLANGGSGDDFFSVTTDLATATLIGGTDNDSLRTDGGYDLSSATISGIETAMLNGNVGMTAAQMGGFSVIMGYGPAYNSAQAYLTQGGIASVNLSATLTSQFTLDGSSQADILTFNAGHLYKIVATMGYGDDNVTTAAGNDSLRGEGGNDTLVGLGGDDSLDGGIGLDLLDGGLGKDYIVARTGDSVLGGGDDDMVSIAEHLPAALSGGTGTGDILRFEGSYDISGAALSGFEILYAYGTASMTAAQFDSFNFVAGYNPSTTTAVVTLTQGGTANIGVMATLTNYFQLNGSDGDDLITFAPGYVGTIYAYLGGGNDAVTASSGNDSLRGDNGNDSLTGLVGNDSLDGGLGLDLLNSGAGEDYLIARAGDVLLAGNDNDFISVYDNSPFSIDGGTGNDTLRFESSYDITGTVLTGIENLWLAGSSVMTAAQLNSFLSVAGYNPGTTGATLYLSQGGTALVNLATTLTSTFNLYGSGEADLITFEATHLGPVISYANHGNDSISGAAGNDTLYGEVGNDTLLGQGGNDSLDGGVGVDLLDGGVGNDVILVRRFDSAVGGANDDLITVNDNLPAVLNGGTGTDTLRFQGSYDISGATISGIEVLAAYSTTQMTAAQLSKFTTVQGYDAATTTATVQLTAGGTVSINLSATLTGTFTLYGSGDVETVTFNNAHLGAISVWADYGNDKITAAAGNDTLRGENGNDSLTGLDGNDLLEGGVGADTLNGTSGMDTLTGGTGRDTFLFFNPQSSNPITPDRITDFEAAGVGKGDLINLAGIDADGGLGVNDAFVFGSVGLGGLSLIDQGTDTLVRLNTDNDADFELVILIADSSTLASTYVAGDFVL